MRGDFMAEFCLECWKKLNEVEDDDDKNYILSKDLDFCEGCGEWKPVVVTERRFYYRRQFDRIIFPFILLFTIIYGLWKLLTLPYLIFKYIRLRKRKTNEEQNNS